MHSPVAAYLVKATEITMHPYPEGFEPLIGTDELQARVRELGQELMRDYEGKDLCLICVLKGATIFLSDLARAVEMPLTLDFLRVSSYEGTKSTGVVRFDFDLTQPIRDKHVIVVEDIIDTGLTMTFLLETLQLRQPASLKVCTLLDKPGGRRADVTIDYTGFTIENRFVIGYGLDLDGLYRNLPLVLAKRQDG